MNSKSKTALQKQILEMLKAVNAFNEKQLKIKDWTKNYKALTSLIDYKVSVNSIVRTLEEKNLSKITPELLEELKFYIYWSWLASMSLYIAKYYTNHKYTTNIEETTYHTINLIYDLFKKDEFLLLDLESSIEFIFERKYAFDMLIHLYSLCGISVIDLITDFTEWIKNYKL